MNYSVRPFRNADAAALADLTLAAIRQIGPRHYSPEQVAAWAARHPGPDRFVERAKSGAAIWIAADKDDAPAAYTLLEFDAKADGHLDMLYCHPDHTRQGLAETLLDQAAMVGRAHRSARLYTEASELARPAFERAGYAVLHRRDFTIDYAGRAVAIHNYAMEKRPA